ncbi:MAG: hypothetical protein ACM31L_14920 [Actinomycetota bacterium]
MVTLSESMRVNLQNLSSSAIDRAKALKKNGGGAATGAQTGGGLAQTNAGGNPATGSMQTSLINGGVQVLNDQTRQQMGLNALKYQAAANAYAQAGFR